MFLAVECGVLQGGWPGFDVRQPEHQGQLCSGVRADGQHTVPGVHSGEQTTGWQDLHGQPYATACDSCCAGHVLLL